VTSASCGMHRGDGVTKNEMGESCGTYGGGKSFIQDIAKRRETDHLKNQGVNGRIVLKCKINRFARRGLD